MCTLFFILAIIQKMPIFIIKMSVPSFIFIGVKFTTEKLGLKCFDSYIFDSVIKVSFWFSGSQPLLREPQVLRISLEVFPPKSKSPQTSLPKNSNVLKIKMSFQLIVTSCSSSSKRLGNTVLNPPKNEVNN